MLKAGLGRTHRAYLWSYTTTEFDSLAAVVYDFSESRSGHQCSHIPWDLVREAHLR
jgi:transposase